MTMAFVSLALGLVLPMHAPPAGMGVSFRPQRSIAMTLSDGADAAKLQSAALRVHSAAKKFGELQGEAAGAWLLEAMEAGSTAQPTSDLLAKQLSLFEYCSIDDDDDGAKCQELDAALSELEAEMTASKDSLAERFAALFGNSKVDRAAIRVQSAATRFGPDQAKVCAEWVKAVRSNGSADPASLLEQQVMLFEECTMGDDEDSAAKCRELQEALTHFQVSVGIGGRVVSLNDLAAGVNAAAEAKASE
jgi:hypothetical protein